jgi:hypothetical protein
MTDGAAAEDTRPRPRAWADPEHRLVFVYLTDRLTRGDDGARHLGAVSDAIIAASS